MGDIRSDSAKLLSLTREHGMIKPKIIKVSNIVVREWVRWKCRYGCPDYGRWLGCPPNSPTPAETRTLLREYKRALLFQMKPKDGYTGIHIVGKIYKTLSELEKKIFLSGYRKALTFGGGECDICDACNIQSGSMSCRNPEISRPSMESCGIDVFETAIKAKYKINILKTKSEDFLYFGMILID